ncbi:MAG: FAD-binding oxidoreductase [Gemmataceae bacterium]|nr:FAD-binding oxidoreductase [Gemmataceae bacterium]MDW8266326.1 FAD-binding oxidoreductase [Gemmataceae bacterium]
MAVSCDVLIVGGGVIGTSLAFFLAQRRVGRVMLLEKSYLGAGASGKSGAIIRQHYSNRLTAAMAQKGLRVFEHFDEIVGGPPVFTRCGLVLIVNDRHRAALEANIAMQRELGIDVRLVSAQVLADIDPNARLAEDEIAAFEAEAGYVEAVQAVASFAEAARREGADLRLGVEVKSLVLEGQRIAGVETNEGRYETRTLVLATGPWAAQLTRTVRLSLPVEACRTQVALFRRPPDFGRRGAVYADFVQGIYFKPTHGEMIHAGSIAGEETKAPVDPDHYNEAADGDWLVTMRQRLGRRYPAMYRGYGRGGFGALYAITPDWHPILDRLPGIEGAFCAVGFSGHGFKMAPVVGQLMTELIVDGQATTLDIGPLRLARFEERDLIQTPYSYGVMG